MLIETRRAAGNSPSTCFLLAEGLALLWLLLVWGRETPTPHWQKEMANGSQGAQSVASEEGQHLSLTFLRCPRQG
jgi:hypothetical protein